MKETDKLRDFTVFHNDRYALGCKDGVPYLIADGKRFTLSCHPYDPCLYIKAENGSMTSVRNSFDPEVVLELFRDGKEVTSITGFRYAPLDFCRMVEYAFKAGDVTVDVAERVFSDRVNTSAAERTQKDNNYPKGENTPFDSGFRVVSDRQFEAVIKDLPDIEVEYRIVKNDSALSGIKAHKNALSCACRDIFTDCGEVIWEYNTSIAEGKDIGTEELFEKPSEKRGINYKGAFLYPPYGVVSETDFDRVNAALFPLGTDGLEIFKWTTDWSDYFDEGREWWGALCFTVYDKRLDRYVIIAASATD